MQKIYMLLFTVFVAACCVAQTRSYFFSNRDVPTSMPRLGVVMGPNMYPVGKDDRPFAKTKIAAAKITVH